MSLILPAGAQQAWRRALGNLKGVDQSEHRLLLRASDFTTLDHAHGESVEDYLLAQHNQPSDRRHTIVLRWLGEGREDIDLQALATYTQAFFQLPVRLEQVPEFRFPNAQRGKVSAEEIQQRLLESMPEDAFALVALTDRDLYSEDNGPDYLLFGQGHYYNRTVVASFNRLVGTDRALFHHRAFKLVSHELLHAYSMDHCAYFRCLMNPSISLEQSDARPLHCCPVCLTKLTSVSRFSLVKRYRDLLAACGPVLEKDRAWLRKRLRVSGS